MRSGELVFDLPLPPNILNERMHWRVKQKAKRDYFAALDVLLMVGRLSFPPFPPLAKAGVSAVLHVGAEHDDDNAMARAYKLPLDWLKTRGYIVDDKRKYVRCAVPEQHVKRDGNYRVEITLTPAS